MPGAGKSYLWIRLVVVQFLMSFSNGREDYFTNRRADVATDLLSFLRGYTVGKGDADVKERGQRIGNSDGTGIVCRKHELDLVACYLDRTVILCHQLPLGLSNQRRDEAAGTSRSPLALLL